MHFYYPSILNHISSIAHTIDLLSIFTIPSLYEVNYTIMTYYSTFPIPLPIALYHTVSPLCSHIFVDIIANSLNGRPVLPCLKTTLISHILKNIIP